MKTIASNIQLTGMQPLTHSTYRKRSRVLDYVAGSLRSTFQNPGHVDELELGRYQPTVHQVEYVADSPLITIQK